MKVAGLGVLIEGAPGVGKSALALELLDRGHRLVADDAVEIRKSTDARIIGRCPRTLHGFLEVRGLGILDVRRHFGSRAIHSESTIDLLVHLSKRAPQGDRLQGSRRQQRLLGVSLPRLQLRPGHNLVVLIEAACRIESLRQKGFDAAATLARRQQNAIRRHA